MVTVLSARARHSLGWWIQRLNDPYSAACTSGTQSISTQVSLVLPAS